MRSRLGVFGEKRRGRESPHVYSVSLPLWLAEVFIRRVPSEDCSQRIPADDVDSRTHPNPSSHAVCLLPLSQ